MKTRLPAFRMFHARLAMAVIAALLGFVSPAHAQWQTTTYSLRGGFNSIYLHGDASYTTVDAILANNPEVVTVWRWNSNANPVQTGGSATVPTQDTPDWSVWTRGNPTATNLTAMSGPAAYLIECAGAASSTYSLAIAQKVQVPRTTWVRNGANLLGFPSKLGTTYPTFASYFATFQTALTGGKVYKYAGGPIGASNPIQIFSTNFELLDRNQAYWFEAPVVADFYAPIEISPANTDGLHYERTGTQILVRLRNRTSATVTMTVTPVASATPPTGQEAILGAVPLIRSTFNATTAQTTETPITGPITITLAAQATAELNVAVDRSQMTGATDSLYASILRCTDSGNLMSVDLPVSARVPSVAGLWVGDISVAGVESKVAGATGTTTVRPFPLRVLLHVDASGTVRLLSQAFLGKLAAAPNDFGLCTRESLLKADEKASARRLVVTNLPLDTEATSGTGSVGLGQTLVRTISIPFNAPTNPYVHEYHPDHDNRDARGTVLSTPVESPNISRTLTFTFASTRPSTSSAVGWGSTVLGGTYSETVTGLHKNAITVTGTFEIHRISEIGSITTP